MQLQFEFYFFQIRQHLSGSEPQHVLLTHGSADVVCAGVTCGVMVDTFAWHVATAAAHQGSVGWPCRHPTLSRLDPTHLPPLLPQAQSQAPPHLPAQSQRFATVAPSAQMVSLFQCQQSKIACTTISIEAFCLVDRLICLAHVQLDVYCGCLRLQSRLAS